MFIKKCIRGNLSLRGTIFILTIIINFILVQLVPDEEAEAMAVTL